MHILYTIFVHNIFITNQKHCKPLVLLTFLFLAWHLLILLSQDENMKN